MRMDHETQLRANCLSEAIRAFYGTGVDADGIVKAAERFLAFTKAESEPERRKRAAKLNK